MSVHVNVEKAAEVFHGKLRVGHIHTVDCYPDEKKKSYFFFFYYPKIVLNYFVVEINPSNDLLALTNTQI
jgi:hypothetical protein